jgi:hypothetical protein
VSVSCPSWCDHLVTIASPAYQEPTYMRQKFVLGAESPMRYHEGARRRLSSGFRVCQVDGHCRKGEEWPRRRPGASPRSASTT